MRALSYPERCELRDGIEKGLGRLGMEFSQLETATACAIGFLAKVEVPVGHILTAETSFKGKVGLFCALYQHRSPQGHSFAALRRWRNVVEQLECERNLLIHSIYWSDSAGVAALVRIKSTAKPKKGLMIQREEISPPKICALLKRIKKATDDIGVLMRQHDPGYGNYLGKFYATFAQMLAGQD